MRPQRGEEHEISIHDLAYGGNGVGRLGDEDGKGGMVVFVPRSAPGDRLRVRLERVKKRHAEASITAVEEPGPGRVEPPCPHYEEGCGGCTWQHLDYEHQLAAKEKLVRDSLERIGGFQGLPMRPIVADDEPWFYRNKMEFSFHARDGLGLHVHGDWRRIVPVRECRLESELAMRVVGAARAFAEEHELSLWDPVAKEGLLRELVIRHGEATGETMVALVTAPGELPRAGAFATKMTALDPSITSVLHATRGIGDGSPIESTDVLAGRETIREEVAGLSFEIGLQTFFQTNTRQAERMAAMVRDRVSAARRPDPLAGASTDGQTDGEGDSAGLVFDVFCGVGFFALTLADGARETVGVEIVEPSIVAARDNARRNDIGNATFYAGNARHMLPEMIERHGEPDVVVLDPPRGGAGGKVMRRIARSEPRRIVYVSCNPTTLARDLQELGPFGYEITDVVPLDLFPQTYHVETIVTVDRTGG